MYVPGWCNINSSQSWSVLGPAVNLLIQTSSWTARAPQKICLEKANKKGGEHGLQVWVSSTLTAQHVSSPGFDTQHPTLFKPLTPWDTGLIMTTKCKSMFQRGSTYVLTVHAREAALFNTWQTAWVTIMGITQTPNSQLGMNDLKHQRVITQCTHWASQPDFLPRFCHREAVTQEPEAGRVSLSLKLSPSWAEANREILP